MTTARTVGTFIAAIHGQLQAAAIRRRQRIALNDLLSMNAARLDDLGLNRHDIIEAIAASRHSEPNLEARRQINVARKLALGAR
jgi:uncharacterized protein YjiS (DUF1127 family)